MSGIRIDQDSLVISLFGGSAWKWEERSAYLFDRARDAFYLVERRTRSYHAPAMETLYEELEALEKARKSGRPLDREQAERLAQLRKMAADFEWKTTLYPMGQHAMGSEP